MDRHLPLRCHLTNLDGCVITYGANPASHAMLVRQYQLGFGYPVVVSEAHEQAVISGHDREEFRRMALLVLEQRGLSTPESAKVTSKRRPWV